MPNHSVPMLHNIPAENHTDGFHHRLNEQIYKSKNTSTLTWRWNVSNASVFSWITPYSFCTVFLTVTRNISSRTLLLWIAQAPAAISATRTSKRKQKNWVREFLINSQLLKLRSNPTLTVISIQWDSRSEPQQPNIDIINIITPPMHNTHMPAIKLFWSCVTCSKTDGSANIHMNAKTAARPIICEKQSSVHKKRTENDNLIGKVWT